VEVYLAKLADDANSNAQPLFSIAGRTFQPLRSAHRPKGPIMTKLRYLASVAIALVIGFAGLAAAQNYPARPITIIVPFAAGGGNDMARFLGQHMGRALGQNFVIENRAGAAGTIGARALAKAPPDGYALMVGHSGVFGVAPALYGANAGYDPRKDFSPVGLIASFTQILVVHPTLPVHTVKDLIALAKKEPGKITYATAGIGSGSHISTELLNSMAGIKLTHLPYRGSGAAHADLVGGHVKIAVQTVPPVIGPIRSGQVRAIAVTGLTRSPIFPDLPTIAESGLPDYDAVIHYGMVAPAGLPRAIVARLNAELNAALLAADVRARIADEGGDALPGTPEQQAADIDAEEIKWGALVRSLGLKAE
jgi:tripartite-type tricarboxylate transporter receptor subunit TctC